MVCTIRVQVIIINFCIHTFTVFTHLCICKFYLFIFRCLHITLTWLTDNIEEVQVYSWLIDCLVARGCTGALPLCAGFSSGGERGLFWVAVHRLPAVVAPLLQSTGFGRRLQQVQHRRPAVAARGLSPRGPGAQSLCGMWSLPTPGIEPVSPAPAGRFSSSAPPGKSCSFLLVSSGLSARFTFSRTSLMTCLCLKYP